MSTYSTEKVRRMLLSLMNSKGWTVAELSRQSKAGTAAISNILKGRRVRLTTITKVAGALNVSPDILFGQSPLELAMLDADARQLVETFQTLDEHRRALVLSICRAFQVPGALLQKEACGDCEAGL